MFGRTQARVTATRARVPLAVARKAIITPPCMFYIENRALELQGGVIIN